MQIAFRTRGCVELIKVSRLLDASPGASGHSFAVLHEAQVGAVQICLNHGASVVIPTIHLPFTPTL